MTKEEKNVNKQCLELEASLAAAKSTLQPASIKKALDDLILFHQAQNGFDKCALYCKEVLAFFQAAGQENELASKYVFIGTCYIRQSDYQNAEANYNIALDIYKETGNEFGLAEVYINIGRIYRELGQFEKGLTLLTNALEIYEKHTKELDKEENLRARHSYCSALEVTGIIYSQLSQFEKAQDYLHRNLKIRKKLGDSPGIMQALINLGVSYSECDPEKTLSLYLEAREYLGANDSVIFKIALINNIGGCYENAGDFIPALEQYHEALQLAEDNQIVKYTPKIHKHIGTVYYKQGLFDLALEKLLLSLELSTKDNARLDMLHCYGALCDVYTAKHEFETALNYQRKVTELKDAMFNEELVEKLSSLQKKYDETSVRLAEVQKQNSLVTEALKKAIKMSFVGVSQSIRQVHELAMTAALHSNTNVLITGESGVGKEIIARLIHFAGPERRGLFVDVNCSSIPESLAESEFFGHTKGAFTGAMHDKAGFLEEANNGTLFLDEIADTPQLLQAKFLRVLETRQVKRLGSNKAIKVDFRLISATNKDISELIQNSGFRADLLYRINTLEIHIPPLRDRKEDIEPILEHYLQEFARIMKKNVPRYDNSLLNYLYSYDFPGNVREFKNMIEKAMILLKGNVLTKDDFTVCLAPVIDSVPTKHSSSTPTMEEMGKQMILDALQAAEGNHTKAAKVLGISYSTFKRKLKAINQIPN
ncbi:MAG: hypothetical protein CVU50_00860 [Candidatus Cloacimonetes bacterium HGW-Cloacimonetes-3]|nr:MAG: hypothetical protein CVU50_00860 [Candidatus Cloacimonetes bacterium HGW-Cloacimonetes-3]